MGTILQIPQAGLATTEEKIKTKRSEVLDVLKASIEGLEYTLSEREENSEIISKWMALNPSQGVRAYDSVKDTFSRNGIPTDEQSKAYIAMLAATAGVSAELNPNRFLISHSLPQRPKIWRQKNSRLAGPSRPSF